MVFKWFALGGRDEKTFEFRCHECGRIHRGSPSFSTDGPPISPDIEDERIVIDTDTCVIDDEEFFIRGMLEVPIEGAREPFSWGLWVSQSRESFERYVETYDKDQSDDGSFGWLAASLPGYDRSPDGGDPIVLACDVYWRDVGLRPLIVPHECDHQLYRDVVNGISWDRAIELARLIMHPEDEC